MTVRALLCVSLSMATTACGPPQITEASLAGTYLHGIEDFAPASMLDVRADHTFELRCATAQADLELGTWRVARQGDRTVLAIEVKRFPKTAGDCIVFAANTALRIQREGDVLGIVPASGAPFRKVR